MAQEIKQVGDLTRVQTGRSGGFVDLNPQQFKSFQSTLRSSFESGRNQSFKRSDSLVKQAINFGFSESQRGQFESRVSSLQNRQLRTLGAKDRGQIARELRLSKLQIQQLRATDRGDVQRVRELPPRQQQLRGKARLQAGIQQFQQRQAQQQEFKPQDAIAPSTLTGLDKILFDINVRQAELQQQQTEEKGGRRLLTGLGIAGLGGVAGVVGTTRLITRPIQTGKAGVETGGQTFQFFRGKGETPFASIGQELATKPEFATGKIAFDILATKGLQKGFVKGVPFVESKLTKFDPRFVPVTAKTINVKTDRGIVNIKIGGSVKDLSEPLSQQVGLAGRKVIAVSAQRDLFGNFVKRKININKPIPNEELLSTAIRGDLRKFREGTLPEDKIIDLNQRIIQESTGSGGLLETSFFADPRGRLRPSRLGLDTNEASFLDLISEDIGFKRSKPQALFFQDVKVAKFPPGLKGVETKLKRGIPLNALEQKKLLRFQLTVDGRFKPIGFLSKEPEIILAKGEVIRRQSTPAVTIINGRRVPIIRAEIVRDAKLSNILKKASNKKASKSELALFKKETGVDLSSITSGRKFVSPSGTILSLAIRSKVSVTKGISSKPFSTKSSSPFTKPSASTFSKRIGTSISGSKPKQTLRRKPSVKISPTSKVSKSPSAFTTKPTFRGSSPLSQRRNTLRRARGLSGFGSVVKPPIPIPRKKPTSARERLRKKLGDKRFQAFVFKNQKKKPIGKFDNRNTARATLKKRLSNTLRASGFIFDRKKNKRVVPKITSGFRKSKTKLNVIVEKRNLRLEKGGREVRDIQRIRKTKPLKRLKNNKVDSKRKKIKF